MEKNYFIKSGYLPNKIVETVDNDFKNYWNPNRLRMAYYDQYAAYKYSRDLITEKNLKSVIDIGCGPAIKLLKLIYPICKNTYGIDNDFIIKYCKKKFQLNSFFADDIENPILNLSKKFDLVMSIDVIEHLNNPDKLLDYIKRLAHKNSFIIISTPERDILRGKACFNSPQRMHIREWNLVEFVKYLKFHKFEIIDYKILRSSKRYFNIRSILKKLLYIIKLKKLKSKTCQLVLCRLSNKNW